MVQQTDIYQSVTNAIIEAIEAGQTAEKFQMPWSGLQSMPINAATEKMYRGVNVPSLWVYQLKYGHPSGLWATYKQWQEKDAQVRKGEKGVPIVFWKEIETESHQDEEEPETRMIIKWSVVFNAAQVDGFTLPERQPSGTAERIAEADRFAANTAATIRNGQGMAFYSPKEDYIGMPDISSFRDTLTSTATENYYSTLLHELTHWTGAAHRLNRELNKPHCRTDYAFEELVAELGAAMLCAMLGITTSTRADHAQYIDGWLKALKGDKRFIFAAASQAQKAVDHLQSYQPT